VGRKRSPVALDWNPTRVELDRRFIKVNERQQTAEPWDLLYRRRGAGTPQTGARGHKEGMVAVAHIAGKPADL